MRPRRAIVLMGLAAPCLLMQLDLSGCLPALTGGGVGGPSFNIAPLPVITVDVNSGVVPLTVRFDSGSSTDDGLIVSRRWDFGDGTTSLEISPTHTFTTTGEFVVRLTLTDDQGAQATRSVRISVTQAPIAVIRVDRTTADSAPAVINFDATESSDPDGQIVEYRWDFGDGSRELVPVVAHTFATSGTFRVRLTVTDDVGVTDTDEVIIVVGIRRQTIEIRVPPPRVTNLVCAVDSPLWIQAVYSVEPGVPRTVRAGLDGDTDPCEAQSFIFPSDPEMANNEDAMLTLSGHDDPVTAVAFSPDGQRVLTASLDGTLRLHDASDGTLLLRVDAASAVHALAFSRGGSEFVYGQANGTVVLRETNTGAVVREFTGHTAPVNAVALSPDAAQILSGASDRRAILWQISDGTILRDFAHGLAVTSVAFSPADQTLVATASADASTRIWNVTSGAEIARFFGHTVTVNAVAFSPDGSRIVTAGDDDRLRVWNVSGGSAVLTLRGHADDVKAAAFSPDGSQIASGGADATVRLWSAQSGALLATIPRCASTISSVGYSRDGQRIVAAVAAENDIVLDAMDSPNGSDLNLTAPVALNLARSAENGLPVPPEQYFLWAEIDTDRTDPVRAYAQTRVNVIEPFTSDINGTIPQIPLVNDRASVVLPPTRGRRIFDLGLLEAGDRLFISLLSTPGFGELFDDALFSLMILDSNQEVYAWYQSGFVLFTRDARLIIGHTSPNYYVAVDGGRTVDPETGEIVAREAHGISVRIEREVGNTLRQQRVLLDFLGNPAVTVADLPVIGVPTFNASLLNPAWGPNETAIIKTTITQTVRNLFAPWNVQITNSDEGPPPATPFQTVYFALASPPEAELEDLFGAADYIDPRNETLTGQALVFLENIADAFPNSSPQEIGLQAGCTAAHEIGHMLGLRHVDGVTDIMNVVATGTCGSFQRTALTAQGEQFNPPAIGIQDAPQYFDEIFGPAP